MNESSPNFRLAAVIFLFSLATHIPGILSPILDYHGWAQTLRASTARNYYEGGMHFFKPEVDYFDIETPNTSPQFPLYSYLVALCYKLFGFHEFLGRMLSALFAAGSAVGLYFLVRLFLEERIAAAGAFVFCCIPVRIYFMRAVMPESMAIFSLIWGTACAALWTRREKFFPWAVLAWFFLTLTALLKLPYLPLLFPAAFLVVRKWGVRSLFRKDIIFLAVLFVLAYLGWYGRVNRDVSGVSGGGHFLAWLLNHLSLVREWAGADFWTTHFLSRFPELLTTYGGLVFFVPGFRLLRKEKDAFFPVWFFTTVAYILAVGEYGRVHQYASLPFAPVNAVFIAAGMVWMWDKLSSTKWRALVVFLALSIPVHAVLRIRHWYALHEQWVFRARDVAAEVSAPGDLFYVNAFDMPFFLYHLRRKGFTGEVTQSPPGHFEKALQRGAKFFFSPVNASWRSVEAEFSRTYRLVYRDDDFVLYDLTSPPGTEA